MHKQHGAVHHTTTIHWQPSVVWESLQLHFQVTVRNFHDLLMEAGDSFTDVSGFYQQDCGCKIIRAAAYKQKIECLDT